jgi:hypothetical protein
MEDPRTSGSESSSPAVDFYQLLGVDKKANAEALKKVRAVSSFGK